MSNRLKSNIFNEIKRNWLFWTIPLIVFFLFSLYIYENRTSFIVPREAEHTVVSQQKSEETVGEIVGQMKISQTFVAEKDQFSRIQMPFGTYQRQLQGTFGLELREVDSGKIIAKRDINLSELHDGVNANLDFPKVYHTQGKKYVFTITGGGQAPGQSATVWKSIADNYKQGQLTIDGKVMSGDLHFSIMDVDMKPLLSKPMFVILGLIFLVLFIFSVLMLRRYKDDLHKAFLVTAIPIGILLVIIIPPFDQLDELEHYYRAFEVSEGLFVNHQVDGQLGNYIPVSLPDTVTEVRYIHQTGYEYSIVKEAFSNKLHPEKRVFMRNYASTYPPIIYIPQAIGMWLGRVLFNSPLIMMFLGRFMNLLCYILVAYFAIRIVPIKKNLFYLLALLPMSFIHAASLSADALTNSSALLFLSYMLYLAYGKVKQITTKHILTAIGIGIFVALAKVVYIPIILLFLIIPLRKFQDKKDLFMKFFIVICSCLIPFIIWNLLSLKNMSVPDLRVHTGVSSSGQVKFILSHPLQYIRILFDTLVSKGPSEIVEMVGKATTNYSYHVPSITTYAFLFMMFLFGLINNEDTLDKKIRRIDKLIFVFVLLSVILLVYTALYASYNTVGAPLIDGVQGRYFIPIAGYLFLSLSNPKFVNREKDINILESIIIHCSMYALLLSYLIQINS
jgi:uncharacterized membrane protein